MTMGINAYDTEASATAQANIRNVCNQLLSVLTGHDSDVKNFSANFEATEVDAMYADVESRLGKSGTEVMNIISLVEHTLLLNDETAVQTLGRAKASVASI